MKVKKILEDLYDKKIIESVDRVEDAYGNPRFYQYLASLNYPHNSHPLNKIPGSCGGFSFFKPQEALIKCIGECMERYSLRDYRNKKKIQGSFVKLKDAVDPALFSGNESSRKKKLNWIQGFDLNSDNEKLLPMQLVYLSFPRKKDDEILTVNISTGAAGGFNRKSAILRGMYECVERDAVMNAYLGRIPARRVDLKNYKIKGLENILNSCQRYNLEILVFDVTSDIQIPVFLSVLLDKTGLGPAVCIGSKSGLDVKKTIMGSIAESFMGRQNLNMLLMKLSTQAITKDMIDPISRRGLEWVPVSMIEKLDFFLLQPAQRVEVNEFHMTQEEELEKASESILSKGYNIFYTDITSSIFRKYQYIVYKVLIPGLQPLYLNEEDKKYINIPRLTKVKNYFNIYDEKINTTPHPFL